MDKDKLINKLALQVAEYNLVNLQLQLRVEELTAQNGDLTDQLWHESEPIKEAHTITSDDALIDTTTLDGHFERIPGKSWRKCSCGWYQEGSKEDVDRGVNAHLFAAGITP